MRKIIFILTSGTAVLTVIVLFFVFQFISRPKQTQAPNLAIPTQVPLQQGSSNVPPNVKYNTQKTNELINKARVRQALSPEGEQAKQNLISNLGNTSGRIFTNNNVTIDYIQSPDLFQSEILTASINAAKQDAANFMLSQGFSPSDVCYLPLSFYLNPEVSSQLKNSGIIFNPLPEGC